MTPEEAQIVVWLKQWAWRFYDREWSMRERLLLIWSAITQPQAIFLGAWLAAAQLIEQRAHREQTDG